MKWYQWLGVMIIGAILVYLGALTLHHAHAKGHPDGGTEILRHRGPGGPPVVGEPNWQIKIAVYNAGPQGGLFTYGTNQTGPEAYATEAECKEAIKKDPILKDSLKKFAAAVAQTGHRLHPFCIFVGVEGEKVD